MKTIKLPINLNDEDKAFINNLRREQSSVVRFSYNRFMEGKDQKEIRDLIKELNINDLDSWYIQSGIMEGQGLYTRFKDQEKPIVFGGKKIFELYNAGKLDKAELKEARLRPLNVEGEAPRYGNRKFELEIVESNRVLFKPFCGKQIYIDLPKLKKNYKKELFLLQQLTSRRTIINEYGSKTIIEPELPYTVKLTDSTISFSFELDQIQRMKKALKKTFISTKTKNETKLKLEAFKVENISTRVLGIDQNPDYLGISVCDFKGGKLEVIHKETISVRELNVKSGEASSHSSSKYLVNKKKHELIQAVKYLSNLAVYFKCGKIAVEDLNFTSKKVGNRHVNRKCNNTWHRNLFMTNLMKRCIETNVELVEVNCAYSSFIGNMLYGSNTCPDMVAASIEIARRCFYKFHKGKFYPQLTRRSIPIQWKDEVNDEDLKDWKSFFDCFKKSKMKYRFSLDESREFLRLNSYKSDVRRYINQRTSLYTFI